MTLKTQMLSDFSVIFSSMDEFAEKIFYTPHNGEKVTIRAIPEDMDPSIMDVPPPADNMILYVLSQEVPEPLRGDVFSISDADWHLVRNLGGAPALGFWKIEISRSDKRRIE